MRFAFLSIFCLSILTLLADGVQPTGAGTALNPYQVVELNHLLWISTNNASWSAHFVQTEDIDATNTQNWNAGSGFSPIGTNANAFTGSYDGQHHTIDGLFIDRSTNNIGLFGKVGGGGVVTQVGLENCDITGGDNTGGLIGQMASTALLDRSYCAGSVSGDTNVGGLAGFMKNTAIMQLCYNDATVDIFEYGGGLCGVMDDDALIIDSYNQGDVDGSCFIGGITGCCEGAAIANCYNRGEVTGDYPLYVCGVNGLEWPGTTISNTFFDGNAAGTWNDYGGTGLTTAEMTEMTTYTSAGWDFMGETTNGANDYWGMHITQHHGYPFLYFEDFTHFPPSGAEPNGAGTEADPCLVANMEHLLWIATHPSGWDRFYRLIANIDASETSGWDDGRGFVPIGDSDTEFTGGWDGNEHTISNLFIDRAQNQVGFFGAADGAVFSDFTLYNYTITGASYTGGICGNANACQFSGCSVAGVLSGSQRIGGLVGSFTNGTMSDCTSDASVTGSSGSVGGLVGYANASTISSCQSDATVTGDIGVGGMVGRMNNTTADDCGSNAMVTGSDGVGGLVGYSTTNSLIELSWAEAVVTTSYRAGGLIGRNEGASIDQCWANSTVTGDVLQFGGFVGLNTQSASITNSFCHGSAEALSSSCSYTGGFAAANFYSSTISNCYSTAQVGNLGSITSRGGFCGSLALDASIENCFWDVETSGMDTSHGGNGLTTQEMRRYANFIDAGWDFIDEADNGVDDYWGINPDENSGYPFLAWQGYEHLVYSSVQPSGAGSLASPYLISSLDELGWVSLHPGSWSASFKQTQNISAAATREWDGEAGFRPIGNATTSFTGQWDGRHYTIDSLYCNRSDVTEQGLFGNTYGATISGVQLTNCDITGQNRVGGLVGYAQDGSVIGDCSVSGVVHANLTCGGLAGMTRDCLVQRCVSEVDVVANHNTGGIAGRNTYSADIVDCYAFGSVSGAYRLGGLIGKNDNAQAVCCFSAAVVTGGGDNVGGLIGFSDNTTGADCFWDIDASGQATSAGGTGLVTSEMSNYANYQLAGWDFVNETVNGVDDVWNMDAVGNNGYPWLQWQGIDSTAPQPPDVQIAVESGAVTLTWRATAPVSYTVYSSDNPDSGFTGDTTGVYSTTGWTAPAPGVKRFYRVTASDGAFRPVGDNEERSNNR